LLVTHFYFMKSLLLLLHGWFHPWTPLTS
jgi:hypothetical protein